MKFVFAAAVLSVILVQPAFAGHKAQPAWQYGSMAGADLGDNANLNGAVPFPADIFLPTSWPGTPASPY